MKGLTVRKNALGIAAVRLHYSCDESKSPDTEQGRRWLETVRLLYPDPHQWDQEMEISFWIATGQRVFPEFTETTHGGTLTRRDRKVIYRAWDFGWHAPAVLFAQIDPKERLLVLRELVGHQDTTKDFAQRVVDRSHEWFPQHVAGFQDFCDPAGQQPSSSASERSEARDIDVLQSLGIFPTWEYGWSRKDGRALIHQLLALRTDDTPGLYIDTAECPVLTQAFLGKYVYPETRGGRAQDEPDEGNHPYADVMACLRYLCTGLYSTLGLRRFRYQPVIPDTPPTFHGYGSPLPRRRNGSHPL